MIQNRLTFLTSLVIAASLTLPALSAPRKGGMEKPDFTKGDKVPEGATHDWTLGATGMRGWIYSNKLETSEARQIKVTKVDKGSPAEGTVMVGDVILGVHGKPFSYDPRTEFGKALTLAESPQGKGELRLILWRDQKEQQVALGLPVLGAYSATAPYDCPKSSKIFEQGCETLAKEIAKPNNRNNPIVRSLNALALLASGEKKYLPLVKKEAEWAANFSADSMATWWYGYVISLVAEYHIATGDDSVMPGLKRLALEAANGQSIVGSWGHKFAGEDGRLLGYGMMNAPGVTLTISLVLAREAGVDAPEVDLAIERSLKLLRFYKGKGSVPYGDHSPWTQTHDDNGKNGMAAVLFSLVGETDAAEYFSRMSLACHGSERDTGHTGNFWNMTWSIPGVAQSGPHATGAWMNEFGAWYFDLARRWDGAFPHQGPPEMRGDKTKNWDSTGAYLLAYAKPLKKILLTGKESSSVPQLSAEESADIVNDGRGWSNNNRNAAYDSLSGDQLFERLSSWSPTVRERAAIAIARKKDTPPPIAALTKMLGAEDVHSIYGACGALARLSKAASPTVPELQKKLKHEDMWVRIKAAEALASIGEPAMVALPELLTMIAKDASEEDPRAMEQRYLSFAVFGKMLKRGSLEGVDRDLLRAAVAAGLKNEDGRARGSVSGVYGKLSYEEIKPLLPAIHEAIVTPAPSGIMFAGEVRLAGVAILAKHKIREGLPLTIEVMDIKKWGKKNRINGALKSIEAYGAGAKPLVPRLKQLATDLRNHREAKNLNEFADRIDALVTKLENSSGDTELRSLK
ncbi:MAG: DUF6288 domain-containing protein [Akkermansiaceae bacterium]